MRSKQGYFIAGTDTDVGKTYVATQLLHNLVQTSTNPVAGLKLVASGCKLTPNGLRNDDALHLQAAASLPLPYEQINPYAFAPAVAPHIAAQQVGVTLCVSDLLAKYHTLQQTHPNVTWIIEGVGGWHVPLNAQETMGDFARMLGLPIILIVGMRLGCLNHTLLTWQAMRTAGVPIAGWIANQPTPSPQLAFQENLQALEERLDAPCLKVILYGDKY